MEDNMDPVTDFIAEIDKRVLKVLYNQNILVRTSAKVISVSDDLPVAEVEFFGDAKHLRHQFPYRRNGLTLEPGDTVYIESKIGDIASGIITDKLFGIVEE